MDASKQTITNLQDACQRMASLANQYRVDKAWVHCEYDLDWLKNRIKKWYSGSEHFLDEFIERLNYYGVQPVYEPDKVRTNDSIEGMLGAESKTVYAALTAFEKYRVAAYDAQDGSTTDLFEHAIQELEHQAVKIEREMRLVAKLGEPGYIGARLEDG